MSILKRFLGSIGGNDPASGDRDTETVRRIAAELERLPPDTAKYLAGFAYILARVAHADLDIDDSETREMERIATSLASLSEAEAALMVQIAKSQARLLGEHSPFVGLLYSQTVFA